jgi:hypothetical protein
MNILTKHTLDKGNTPKDILLIRRLIENEGTYLLIPSQELKNMKRIPSTLCLNTSIHTY